MTTNDLGERKKLARVAPVGILIVNLYMNIFYSRVHSAVLLNKSHSDYVRNKKLSS